MKYCIPNTHCCVDPEVGFLLCFRGRPGTGICSCTFIHFEIGLF